jgi:hypothetical protein
MITGNIISDIIFIVGIVTITVAVTRFSIELDKNINKDVPNK